MSSKRHSLPLGPRPLQLTNGLVTDGPPSAPLSAHSPSGYFPSPLSPTTPGDTQRRPSSITYNPTTRPSRSAGHRSTLARSNSVGGALDHKKTVPDRSPVTLAEKHADLLHFIAQKESKCLELRSQLTMHEAELLQLKRKWERIVSRGFMSPHNTNLASTSSSSTSSANSSGSSMDASPNPTSANGGAVLDGIREGVQGVGRFIAAFSPTPYSAFDIPRGGTHSTSSSVSTMATATTKSTRFSQSSASSLGDEPAKPVPEQEHAEADADGDAQVLMVQDTGATPTMSPNPAFAARRAQNAARSPDSSAEAEDDFFFASAQAAARTSTPAAAPRPAHSKRTASAGALPGLASVAPMSAWVGNTVSKKWEELQRAPTFAKNTKRASLLFSDIAYVLQVGSPAPSSPSPSPSYTGSASTSAASLLDDDDGGAVMMPDAPALTPTTPAALAPVRPTRQQQQPQSPLSLSKSKVPPKPKPPQKLQQTQTQAQDDDDEEWNW